MLMDGEREQGTAPSSWQNLGNSTSTAAVQYGVVWTNLLPFRSYSAPTISAIDDSSAEEIHNPCGLTASHDSGGTTICPIL